MNHLKVYILLLLWAVLVFLVTILFLVNRWPDSSPTSPLEEFNLCVASGGSPSLERNENGTFVYLGCKELYNA